MEPQRYLPVLDLAIARERVGGDEDLLREIALLLLDEYPPLLDEIRAALEASDAARLERAAHTLKGSMATVGAEGVRQASFRLETLGRGRTLGPARDAFQALEREIEALRPELLALGGQDGQ